MAEFQFRGISIAQAANRLRAGFVLFAQNVRQLIKGAFGMRNVLAGAIVTLSGAVVTIKRLNDSTPNGPSSGFAIIAADANGNIYCNSTLVATGLSGNPVSMIPFRPNASVQPWMYIGDSAAAGNVTLNTKYALTGASTTFKCAGMLKVRSDGLVFKMGIEEPQTAPIVTTQNTSTYTNGTLLATAIPWTNNPSGTNPSYDYGETNGYPYEGISSPDGTAPFIINCQNATTVTITSLTGTATINGGSKSPNSAGPSSSGSTTPGHFTMSQDGMGTTPASANPSVVIGAFCDASGNVVPKGVAPLYIPSVVDVGVSIGSAITVPYGAVTFQVGINSTGNTFSSNSGSFALTAQITTDALPSVLTIYGNLTAYYWGDTPHGTDGVYFYKNPDDVGSGTTREISTAGAPGPGGTAQAPGYTTGNSFIIDATITGGVASTPGIGTKSVPATWSTLNPDSTIVGSTPLFTPALESDGYADWNTCIVGNLYVPKPGTYTFTLKNKDSAIWGIGGGATWAGMIVAGQAGQNTSGFSPAGQTETVVNGLPLLPINQPSDGDGFTGNTTVSVTFPNAGTYPIEIDWCFYDDSSPSRILLLTASPTPGAAATCIPPLPVGVRENVSYACKYRSSLTGAVSNPGPVSTPQLAPVLANSVAAPYSPDPQVDKVDYYRQDSGLTSYTFVATGPNDNGQGGGVNTAIVDSLSDLAVASNPTMNYDDFEPFPSIDLPRSGTCSVSGGVITAGSGDTFNPRWLPGTVIEIGAPTQIAYTLISRPVVTENTSTSATSSTSNGTSPGGGSPWTTPANISSSTSYASVAIGSGGGGTYNPSSTTGSVSAPEAGTGINTQTLTFSGFSSVTATSATAYITLSGSVSGSGTYGGVIYISYSVNGGTSFTTVQTWTATFASTTVPIVLSGVTNLDLVQIQVTASATTHSGTCTAGATVTNCYASTATSGSNFSQTLSALITNLSIPAGANIAGVGISFKGYYVGAAPALTANLSVGTEIDSVSLTTSPATYNEGGPTDLWGYASWTVGTFTGLSVQFNASATSPSTVYLNDLVITVSYPEVPASSTMTIPGVPDGTNLTWNIAEPILAQQPLPYLFGPTDNIVTMHGVGDPLRPGVDYWTKGNNFDSAPDTNQQDVVSPSEPLVNGAMSGGLGILGSIARFWIIAPNQFSATATVTGTQGSTWTYRLTSINRGLYMPRCLAVFGGGTIAFRVEDGIHLSRGGSASQSITDETLYQLFEHEGSTPTAITLNGKTVYPPDDTKPQLQQFAAVSQFLYYDYQGIDGNPYTLVFDMEAMAWFVDQYAISGGAPEEG